MKARCIDESTPTRAELDLYMPLVDQVVTRVLRRLPPNVLREDLRAAGAFGLVGALRKSIDRGPAFEWYARVRIRGAVMDELRTQDWLTRKARARVSRARAEGAEGSAAIVRFDDLSGAQAGAFADESVATPEEQVGRRMDRRVLERAVGHLPKREGNIVAWHYFDDVPFNAIATRLCVSAPRVSQLHAHAMSLLRASMAEPSSAEAAQVGA
jgi:RNA polymerase sigma factor for flagellar operon FliA